MANENIRIVTCKSPVNIAVIKYWGKRDEELMLPLNDSISLTLDTEQMCARTTVAMSNYFTTDKLWLNGLEANIDSPRIQNCLKYVRDLATKDDSEDNNKWNIHICSENNFPTAAGLASSAAGYACLAFSLAKLYGLNINVSEMARLGSGSACRSVFGGFVHWKKGIKEDGSDSIAYQIAPASHWPDLRVLILVVNDEHKTTSSTHGMQCSVNTSKLLKYRIESVIEERVEDMIDAIKTKNFEKFATITMQESNQLHAICLDSWPAITYLNDTSMNIMSLVSQFNELNGKNVVAYTFDAGPNAFLFTLKNNLPVVLGLIKHYFPNDDNQFFRGISINNEDISADLSLINKIKLKPTYNGLKFVIHTKLGNGPECVTNPNEHLINEFGKSKYD